MGFRSISDIAAEGQADAAALSAVNAARQQHQVNVPAYQARGKALADLAISEARGQGSAWSRFYRDMLGLEAEGRKAFRSTIAAHQKAMQSHVKAASGEGEENPAYAAAKRSAQGRLSELTQISKALDVGIEFDSTWPFHYAVGHARTALRAQGLGSTKGRKAGSWMDKFKAYVSKNVPADEMDRAVELLETMSKLAAGKQ